MNAVRTILLSSLFVGLIHGPAAARIFFVGSNPHLSMFAFPQDILLVPGESVYYYLVYQRLPWWGDFDEPDHRPNKEYILTGDAFHDSNEGVSYRYNSSIHAFRNSVGFTRELSEQWKARFDLRYAFEAMRSKAEGTLDDSGAEYSYKGNNSIQELYLQSTFARVFRDVPVGFRVGIGGDLTTRPNSELRLRDGSGATSDRLLWGWKEDGERFQDEYAHGPLFKLDLQSAATMPRIKYGGRFRFHRGVLDQYSWTGDELQGKYEKSAKKIGNVTFRVYGNYNWITGEHYKLNTLVLSRFTHVDSIGVLPENLSAETGERERSRTFVLQCNPNINIYPWPYKMTYIDLALLCNFSHMRYDFRRRRWTSGGYDDDAYASSRVRVGEDYSWHPFSYARETFFELAFDMNSAVPIYGRKDRTVALGITLLLWRRFKWMNKYYGTYPTGEDFTLNNIRYNLDIETWLNSAFNIIYRRGRFNYRLDIGQPLIYTLTPRTRVVEADGGRVLYEKTRNSMWLSQSGVRLGFFVSTSMGNFLEMKNQLFNRPQQ
jgi:hypothetical protein